MKKNIGTTDKTIRIILAVVILYFTSTLSGTAAVILLIIAGVLIVTSLINFCPLYSIFNISTFKINK